MAAGAPLAVRYREVVDETFYGGELLESSTYSGANVFSSKEAYQEAAERVDAKYSWVDAINWDDEQLVVFVAGFGADDVRFHTLDYRFGRSGDGLQLDIHFVGLSYCTCDCFIFQISRALIVDRSAGIISDVQIHEQPACADAPVLPDDGADIGDAGL